MKLSEQARDERDRVLDCVEQWLAICDCKDRMKCFLGLRKQIVLGKKSLRTRIKDELKKRNVK